MADQQLTVNFPHTTFSIHAAKSKRSAIGKRDLKGAFIEVDISKIPEKVLFSLITDALESYVQAGLKKSDRFNPETADVDQIKEVMQTRLREKLAGKSKTAAKATGRGNPVRLEAKRMMRESFLKDYAARDIEPDKKELTARISQLFKDYDKWAKNPAKNPELEARGKAVEKFIDLAQKRVDLMDQLATAVGESGLSDVPVEAPTPRPTPTERVKSQKAASGKKGRSA